MSEKRLYNPKRSQLKILSVTPNPDILAVYSDILGRVWLEATVLVLYEYIDEYERGPYGEDVFRTEASYFPIEKEGYLHIDPWGGDENLLGFVSCRVWELEGKDLGSLSQIQEWFSDEIDYLKRQEKKKHENP